MCDANYKKLDIDDGNGHEWFEIMSRPFALVGRQSVKNAVICAVLTSMVIH